MTTTANHILLIAHAPLAHALMANYLDKHDALNRTARALTEAGLSWVAAPNLHHR